VRTSPRVAAVRAMALTALAILGVFAIAVPSLAAQTKSTASSFTQHPLARDVLENPVLTLGALLDSVATRHPLVAASRARVREAEAARTTAGTFGNPVLGFEVDNTPFPWNRSITLPPGMERESMTTATIPLEPLFQRSPRVRQADAELRATRADAVGERQRVAGDAARAFYRTALAQVGVDVARDLASWLDTLVSYNSKRVDQGAVAEADLIRSQLERDRALADQTMEEAELARARAQLSTFLGNVSAQNRLASRSIVVSAGSAPLPLALAARQVQSAGASRAEQAHSDSTSSESSIDGGQRPDVLAAREHVAASRAAITSERTMLFRQVGATFGVKRSAGTASMIAGVSLPIPLFDQNRGEVARAQAEREVAVYVLADRERTASAEVSGALESARLLTERAQLLTGAMATDSARAPASFLVRADDARRIALGAYREGAVPLIQVLDAARAWGEARRAFYQILYAQHESVLDLLAAEGVDLQEALNDSTQHTSSSPSHE
jgi:outer membrane protein, heavy metal efflux system